MTPPLWRLMLVTNFGRGSRRPLYAAAYRLALAAVAGLATGLALACTLRAAPLPHGLPLPFLAGATGASAFALTALAFLSLSAAVQRHRGAMPKLTATLPIKQHAAYALILAPLLIVWALSLTLTVPALTALAQAAAAPLGPLLAALLTGSLSGLGLVLLEPASVFIKSLLVITLTLLSARLLTIYTQSAPHPHSLPLIVLAAAVAAPLAGFATGYLTAARRAPAGTPGNPVVALPRSALRPGWFALKLLRNRRTLASLAFSLTIAFATAAAVIVRHLAPAGGPGWLLVGAILAAALATDIRGLSPRRRAPEIEALHGTARFVRAETLAALAASFALGLPMLAVLLAARATTPLTLIATFLALQTSATLIGLLASTVFVPAAGDLGSQFFAAATATTVLLALPRLLHLESHGAALQAAAWLTVSAACYSAVLLIEHQRRLS